MVSRGSGCPLGSAGGKNTQPEGFMGTRSLVQPCFDSFGHTLSQNIPLIGCTLADNALRLPKVSDVVMSACIK